MSDDWCLYLHDSKWNSISDVDGLTITKDIAKFIVHSIY